MMGKYLTLILIIYSAGVLAQTKVYKNTESVTIGDPDGVIITYKDKKGKLKSDTVSKVKPKVFYGIAGIKQELPQDTLKRYYFHRYLFFMNRMNETTGKKSARMEDSANYYYKKLYKK